MGNKRHRSIHLVLCIGSAEREPVLNGIPGDALRDHSANDRAAGFALHENDVTYRNNAAATMDTPGCLATLATKKHCESSALDNKNQQKAVTERDLG